MVRVKKCLATYTLILRSHDESPESHSIRWITLAKATRACPTAFALSALAYTGTVYNMYVRQNGMHQKMKRR